MRKPFVFISLIVLTMLLIEGPVTSVSAVAPDIQYTYVPAYGTPIYPSQYADFAKGRILNEDPANYANYYIVCYIYVPESLPFNLGWWIKPRNDNHYWETAIDPDGSWKCDVNTGGYDEKATIIESYLIPKTLISPTAPTRPWLQTNAIAIIAARRVPSMGSQDGWVLECGETSNTGCAMNAVGYLRAGDNGAKKQFRSILSFSLANQTNHPPMPVGSTVSKISIKISKTGITGKDPFTTHGNLFADMRKGCFGTSCNLQISDFQAPTSASNVGRFKVSAPTGWYQLILGPANYQYVNLTGQTQFRLRFGLDDNNDNIADFVGFYDGDVINTTQWDYMSLPPALIIEYKIL